ncbi:hypothetical protein [Chishuiella changwenlii]|jgi:hypothetical protein|uniref:hypothetical protein n=1 Tax=Chishuiella changwenlii TaxID=1434701 RepID=UPI002FDAB987
MINIKRVLSFVILLISFLCYSQKSIKHPIFPGCNKLKTNEELGKCFSEKLWYELNDQTQYSAEDFFKEDKLNNDITLFFTVKKDGKVTDFSFSKDSDPVVSTAYLKRISKVFKYYEKKGKKIIPAFENNQYVDYKIVFKVESRVN